MKKPFTHERWNDCSSMRLIHRATDEERRELEDKEVEQIIKGLSPKDKTKMNTPTFEQLNLYLEKWDKLYKYPDQEKAVDKVFYDYPNNKSLEDILIKASVLNDFYSTRIFDVYSMAKHIYEDVADFDEKIKGSEADTELVKTIAAVSIKGKEHNFTSFASKYCSHHNPIAYPIYDSYVIKLLSKFNSEFKFAETSYQKIRTYEGFYDVISAFRDKYFKGVSFKDLDKFLWILGKELFGDTSEPTTVVQPSIEPVKKSAKANPSIHQVRNFIINLIEEAREKGLSSIVLKSGEIHKHLNMSEALPTVCNAMKTLGENYPFEIVSQPPKGLGARLFIEYKIMD